MMEESKYLIFDNPIDSKKYYAKRCIHFLKSMYYTFQLNSKHPAQVTSKKYYVSICAIFKNEARYFKEWIEFHKIIGIDHFYLYNNFSDDNYEEVLKPYIESGLVTLTQWPVKQGQMAAYKDCVGKYKEESNWICFLDLDEYIVPNHSDNIGMMLKPFEKNRPVVIAYWRLFGSSGMFDRDTKGIVTEDFYLCWRKYTNIGKFFYNTAYEYSDELPQNNAMHNHWVKLGSAVLPPVNFYNNVICGGIDVVCDDYPPVQINHYFTKSYSEYLEKKARGDAYYEMNPRDEEYFDWHDMKCQSTDYNIRKYMIKLKKAMGVIDCPN